MTVKCLAAKKPKGSLEPHSHDPGTLGPNEVEIRVTHCGICHSDIHLIDDDWGMSSYPLVPGHEIVGTVTSLGSSVKGLAKGARVGVGWQRSACLECEHCVRGNENLCAKQGATCVGNPGGFSDSVRADSRFAFPIPEKLASENAAPLLCGGITVYSPLRHFEVTPNMKVGVIGIGGLGHLAVQFARAMGCEVTAFSSSPSKEKEALALGAHRFVATETPGALDRARSSIDFLLATATANLDWAAYIEVLRPDGTLCFVGVPSEPIRFPVFSLLGGRKRVCASPIGGRARIAEMLEFAARHGIAAKTESVPMAEANAAIEKVRANKARYRMVLRNP